MLTNSLKTPHTTKTEFSELISFESDKKNMTKILPCRFKQSFRTFIMLTFHRCCDTGLFEHVNNSTICSLHFQKEITSDVYRFLKKYSKFYVDFGKAKKNEKIFIFEIIVFELVPLKIPFYWERTHVIVCQYVNKQSQDYRHY